MNASIQATGEHFNKLISIDMSKKIKVLQRQRYIPWVDQWAELKKLYPDSSYNVIEDENGLPYFSSKLGIFVKVEVTVEGETIKEIYPVMNGANKAIKEEAYTYKVKEYANKQPTGQMIDKTVESATSFDINTAIKRCLSKCIALHGLGLYVYQDEAMPEVELINSSQLHEITNLCSEKNISISDLSKAFGINKLTEFYASTFDNAIEWVNNNARN